MHVLDIATNNLGVQFSSVFFEKVNEGGRNTTKNPQPFLHIRSTDLLLPYCTLFIDRGSFAAWLLSMCLVADNMLYYLVL